MGPKRKQEKKHQILMNLIKLKLDVLLEDLSDWLRISAAHCGRVYTCWLRAIAKLLQHLIFSRDKEALLATTPTRLKKRGFQNVCAILDCSEILLKCQKGHKMQALTWSDYKHHNKWTFLKCVAPNSSRVFISDLWMGGISHKKLTNSCVYLDTSKECSEIMVDKGFHFVRGICCKNDSLVYSPSKKVKAQMDPGDVRKTPKIANLMILA